MTYLIGNVVSQLIGLKPVELDDAPFIVSLRTSAKASSLKPISSREADQVEYIKNYLDRYVNGDEVYFVVLSSNLSQPIGLVRIHEINEPTTFNWASFIMSDEASPVLAIEVALVIYSIGFDLLQKKICGPFPVEKSNKRLIQFHEEIGMSRVISQTKDQWILETPSSMFHEKISKYRKKKLGTIQYVTYRDRTHEALSTTDHSL